MISSVPRNNKHTELSYAVIVLAGGRSSRLGGIPKATLSNGEKTLVEQTLDSVGSAQLRVVVGPPDLPGPQDVLITREEPVFSGPAAGLRAGLEAISEHCQKNDLDPMPWVLILACDMPFIAQAVDSLVNSALQAAETDTGFCGICDEQVQPLAGIYRYEKLISALSGEVINVSVRKKLFQLNPEFVMLSSQSTADIDTWDAAEELGFTVISDS